MAGPGSFDAAGRQIAGLLGYNPGPGIYSRLERAIEQMPENVRVQELPGLLKRYKDGVPGWELKATGLDELTAGRDVVSREELLTRVKERSPVYTHKEVVLTDSPPTSTAITYPEYNQLGQEVRPAREITRPEYQGRASGLGRGTAHGPTKYGDYSQGGEGYTEILVRQPGAMGTPYGNHWSNVDGGDRAVDSTVAHARFDTHGDALRINELQSDLGIHNRKAREAIAPPRQEPNESDYAYAMRLEDQGYDFDIDDHGRVTVPSPKNSLPFPLEDAWADLLIKRIALEAAGKGHRAIEVASPRAIADKVGGNIDNYEHFYGKVVPGALERLGRKMGGLSAESPAQTSWTMGPWESEMAAIGGEVARAIPTSSTQAYRSLMHLYAAGEAPGKIKAAAEKLASTVPPAYAHEMPEYVSLAQREGAVRRAWSEAKREYNYMDAILPPNKRYIMSDEMRRRIIQEGIPAAVAIGIGADAMIDRLGREQR